VKTSFATQPVPNDIRRTRLKWGRDSIWVVDGNLKVYRIENRRVADRSIMPRVTTGNTMAPCVIIGERAAEVLRIDHKL
jgi:choline dehydrogenase